MQPSIIIIIMGIFIFWGYYLREIFEKKSIPDVLGLMLVGILIGPVFKIIDPTSFGVLGPLFSNLVLIFILFESGTELKISEIKSSFKDSASITALSFVLTWIAAFILCRIIFELSWITCLFIGATLGGTSSAVVVGLVRNIPVDPKTEATLIIESAESDIFSLAIPLGLLGLMMTGEMQAGIFFTQFILSFIISILSGIAGAYLWSYIINKIPTLKTTSFSTPAFLFILYGVIEHFNFSGALTALSFGVSIGNLQYFKTNLPSDAIPKQSIVLPKAEKDFFNQIVFLLRLFFFVFIGIKIQIERLDWLMWGAIITFALFIVRIITVKLIIDKESPLLDKAVLSLMIPKGLGAAVIATLPLQKGHVDGNIVQSICFSTILFSTLYCVGLFFLAKRGISIPFYAKLFGKDKSS